MKIICNPAGIVDEKRPRQGLQDIVDAGFDETLLSTGFCCPQQRFEGMARERRIAEAEHLIYVPDHPDMVEKAMEPFIEAAKQIGVKMSYCLASFLPRDRKNPELNQIIVPIIEEAVRLAVRNGCKGIIVRPLYAGISVQDEWNVNYPYLIHLSEIANEELQKLDKERRETLSGAFQILIENQCKYQEGHLVRGVFSDPYEINRWLETLQQEAQDRDYDVHFGLCMNTGILSICGMDIYEFTMEVSRWIGAVVIQDNDGHVEDGLMPFSCVRRYGFQTRWLEVIRGLRSISFDGLLILNIESSAKHYPPLLRPEMLKLSKSIMDYFVWQVHMADAMKKYDHVVLFGAGNMCRNYLKNYGEKYPPLFTCDNNPARWGEDFYGIKIESPEKLRDLPENTGIFICNIYYREIEKQLQDMGITEGIEFFNDEFLQTFYMDRLRGL